MLRNRSSSGTAIDVGNNAARTFDATDRRVIAPGKRADLLLVRGDPTVIIMAARDIASMWRGGVEFDRELRDEDTQWHRIS